MKITKKSLVVGLDLIVDVLCVIGFIFIMGVVGSSDLENALGVRLHSDLWYLVNIGLFMIMMGAVYCISGISKRVKGLSYVHLDRMIRRYGFEDERVIKYAQLLEKLKV